jgi:gliding motility-associated transport system permease protein
MYATSEALPHVDRPAPPTGRRATLRTAGGRSAFTSELWELARLSTAVWSWELKTFFRRPASYLLLLGAALTAAWSFSWLVTLLSRGQAIALRAVDDPIVQFIGPNLFLIGGCTLLVPLLSMNAIADERRSGRWEHFITAPVSPLSIVLGKFAAIWCLLLICLLPWLYYLAVLRWWNGSFTTIRSGLDFDFGTVLAGCVGLAVVGMTFAAIGLVCSALCRRPASAALLSFLAMGLLLLIGMAPRILEYWGFPAESIRFISALSCWGHVERFSRGVIELPLIAGHLTVSAILIWSAAAACRRGDEA